MWCEEALERCSLCAWVKWYTRAAESGHVDAQNNLGTCYMTGDGFAGTNEAEAGDDIAQKNLGHIYKNW